MSQNYDEDRELVARIVSGDRGAWAELVERHGTTMRFAIERTLGLKRARVQPHRVDDILADLILALAASRFRKLSKYQARCSLKQWLKVVSANFTVDKLRRQRHFVPIATRADDVLEDGAVHLVDPGPSPSERVEYRERAEKIGALLEQLCDEDKLFVELYYRREHSYERVAELMGTTIGAVYARKTRLRKRLQKLARAAALI